MAIAYAANEQLTMPRRPSYQNRYLMMANKKDHKGSTDVQEAFSLATMTFSMTLKMMGIIMLHVLVKAYLLKLSSVQ